VVVIGPPESPSPLAMFVTVPVPFVAARSYAVFTAFAVAASVVLVLEVVLFSCTIPAADVVAVGTSLSLVHGTVPEVCIPVFPISHTIVFALFLNCNPCAALLPLRITPLLAVPEADKYILGFP